MKKDHELERICNEFPDRLSRIIREKGMNNIELTHKMAISSGRVNVWCDGIAKPDMLSIMKLANALEITIDELIGFEP